MNIVTYPQSQQSLNSTVTRNLVGGDLERNGWEESTTQVVGRDMTKQTPLQRYLTKKEGKQKEIIGK